MFTILDYLVASTISLLTTVILLSFENAIGLLWAIVTIIFVIALEIELKKQIKKEKNNV